MSWWIAPMLSTYRHLTANTVFNFREWGKAPHPTPTFSLAVTLSKPRPSPIMFLAPVWKAQIRHWDEHAFCSCGRTRLSCWPPNRTGLQISLDETYILQFSRIKSCLRWTGKRSARAKLFKHMVWGKKITWEWRVKKLNYMYVAIPKSKFQLPFYIRRERVPCTTFTIFSVL